MPVLLQQHTKATEKEEATAYDKTEILRAKTIEMNVKRKKSQIRNKTKY